MGGATSVSKREEYFWEWLQVISGKIVNCFSFKDMVLHTYKATTLTLPIGWMSIFDERDNV